MSQLYLAHNPDPKSYATTVALEPAYAYVDNAANFSWANCEYLEAPSSPGLVVGDIDFEMG